MEKKKIYNVVVLNEEMEIVSIKSYTNEENARLALNEDYERTKEMLNEEGWDEEYLGSDDLTPGKNYLIEYGESSYYAEVYPSFIED